MNKVLRISCLLLLCIGFTASNADAQFWKKKERKPVRKKPATARTQPQAVKPKKPKSLDYPPSKIKHRYRVDVLLPLYLEELVPGDKVAFKDRMPEKAVSGYNFYEGVQMAADTLTSLGYNIDVYVHDISQESLSPENIVKYKKISGSDLIIGLVSSNQIPVLAEYAKKTKVNFISALSPSDADVRNNPFFTIIQPTLRTHCEKVRAKAIERFQAKNLVLIGRTNNSVDSAAYAYTINGYEKNMRKVMWNTAPAKAALDKVLDSVLVNPVLLPVVDPAAADSILDQLEQWYPRYEFAVYGMPSWRAIGSIRKSDAYKKMLITFSVPFNFDNAAPVGQLITTDYRRLSGGGRPSEMVFRGFETLYWYAYLLQKYGTIFNAKLQDTDGAAFTKFDVKPQWTQDNDLLYLENEHAYFYKYQAGSYTIE